MRYELRGRKKQLKDFIDLKHIVMEQEIKEMNENERGHKVIREFLLGTLNDKAKKRELERNMLLDESFAEEIFIAENKLIEDYLDNNLDESQRRCFEQFYLCSPQRKQRVKMITHLRRYAMKAEAQPIGQFSNEKTGIFEWRQVFSPRTLGFAMVFLIVACAGLGTWRLASFQSPLDMGLAQLHLAYKGQRSLEPRIADFDYASLTDERGAGEPDATDTLARDKAFGLLTLATVQNPTPASWQALGQFCLAEKDFDKASGYFERALALAPMDAKLHSDLGAVLLEAGKKAKAEKDGKGSELYNKSLWHIEKAIELNPTLLEPYFNKALNREASFLQKEAIAAWQKYLELDPDSDWAKEARQHLRELELKETQNFTGDQVEKAFLTAFREKNDVRAEQIISRNRELIVKKYLPQKLAMSLVESPLNERDEYLHALVYAGELEKKAIGDPFGSDIAAFYQTVSERDLDLLKNAQASMQKGYELAIRPDFNLALKEFESARATFLQVGDTWEARLSELFIVYCLSNSDRVNESIPVAEVAAEYCRKNNYKWLHSTMRFWLAAAQRVVRRQNEAKANFQISLDVAKEINDSLLIQLILMAMARHCSFIGQNKEALEYLQIVFENGDAPEASLRQKWRNYSDGIELLANAKMLNLAEAVSLENMRLLKDEKRAGYDIYSQIDAGIALSRAGRFDEARQLFDKVKQDTADMRDEAGRKEVLTKTFLETGNLERKQGNYSQAEQLYDEAYSYIENTESPHVPSLYEIQKGRLFVYAAEGDDDRIEQQLGITIGLAERYRREMPKLKDLIGEWERVSFFDNQQPIYDLAVSNSFAHGRYEQAYNYLETSNARSLLNWLQKYPRPDSDYSEINAHFGGDEPLRLEEIRHQMPENVQILQFAVLEDKVLICLVTKDKFVVVPSAIGADELDAKVRTYLQLVRLKDAAKQAQADMLAAELYTLLIDPIAGQLDPDKIVCLIPQKILVDLPFAGLIEKTGSYFLSKFELIYAPSANIFLLCTHSAKNKAVNKNETLLSVGNPDFDKKAFADLNELSAAENEALEIAKLYLRPQKLIGPAATKSAFVRALPNAEIVQFAGHYVIRKGEPLSSSLILASDKNDPANEMLTNAELSRLSLPRTKLVVLSACQTGVEEYYNGEGLVGLSRTFLAAGVPLVVASNWRVDSKATAELMKRFHFYRRQGKLSTTAALRRAQLEMIESPDERFRQPYYWAAFAAFGGYAEF